MGRSELCAWLRANSSGIYRPAAEAATEIEMLAEAKDNHFAQAMANGAAALQYRDEAEALRKDAERWRKLEAHATEQLLHPSRAACESMPDLRTHWKLPVLMCSGPVGGHVSFADAVDALPAVG